MEQNTQEAVSTGKKIRATKKQEITLPDGRKGWEYTDGSIRGEAGRMLQPIEGKYTITQADASTLALKRYELKRQRVQAGANAAVAKLRPDEWTSPQDLDYAEAIAEAVAMKALNPLDPKQTDAARFIYGEAAIAEAKQQEAPPPQRHILEADPDLLALLREAREAKVNLMSIKKSDEVVDAEVQDTNPDNVG